MSPCQPAARDASIPGWHWLADAQGKMTPAQWRKAWHLSRGSIWVWRHGGRFQPPETMGALGYIYRGKAMLPPDAQALKARLLEAIDTLEFGRPEPIERGRSPGEYAAHLLRLALEQGGLRP